MLTRSRELQQGIHKKENVIFIFIFFFDQRNVSYSCLYYTGMVYTYLAESVGHSVTRGAFCALTRGFAHWSSGTMDRMEVNLHHPELCHVKCTMTPSMKQGSYQVYILLRRDGDLASVAAASCECAAGRAHSLINRILKIRFIKNSIILLCRRKLIMLYSFLQEISFLYICFSPTAYLGSSLST